MLEQIRPAASAGRARVALFDFDGTLSPIRAGWTDVMVPMMAETSASITGAATILRPSSLPRDWNPAHGRGLHGSHAPSGGTVANSLAALRVGRGAVLGAMGDDGFGDELHQALTARRIDPRLPLTVPGPQTFTCTKTTNLVRP